MKVAERVAYTNVGSRLGTGGGALGVTVVWRVQQSATQYMSLAVSSKR